MPTREQRARQMGIPIDELPDRRGKHGNHARGAQHGRWNGNRVVSSQGYIKLKVGKVHPLADPNGYAYEHTIVWVSAGNPLPLSGYILHHINGDKTDNRISNLALMTQSAHVTHHNHARRRAKQ